jgi:hypothetical protein
VPATLSALKVFISTLLDKVPSQTNIEYSFVSCYMQKFLYTLGQYEVVSVIFYTVDNERSSTLQNEASAKSALADATSVAEKSHSSFDQHAHELAE